MASRVPGPNSHNINIRLVLVCNAFLNVLLSIYAYSKSKLLTFVC